MSGDERDNSLSRDESVNHDIEESIEDGGKKGNQSVPLPDSDSQSAVKGRKRRRRKSKLKAKRRRYSSSESSSSNLVDESSDSEDYDHFNPSCLDENNEAT